MRAAAPGTLFCFGLGYTAGFLARALIEDGWRIRGTCRTPDACQRLAAAGIEAHRFDRAHPLENAAALLAEATHVLSSVPPDEVGDPVLDAHGRDLAALSHLRWLGYLSTTGVYGNRDGGWVDESSPLAPSGERGRRRVAAEQRWLESARTSRASRASLPPRRHLRPRAKRPRHRARGPRPAHRQARPGVLAHPCRGHRRRRWQPRWRGPILARSTISATTIRRRRGR